MNAITESIFNGTSLIIPYADVQHVEKHVIDKPCHEPAGFDYVMVITKHTTWNFPNDTWENAICIDESSGEASKFIAAWCRYRAELAAAPSGAGEGV